MPSIIFIFITYSVVHRTLRPYYFGIMFTLHLFPGCILDKFTPPIDIKQIFHLRVCKLMILTRFLHYCFRISECMSTCNIGQHFLIIFHSVVDLEIFYRLEKEKFHFSLPDRGVALASTFRRRRKNTKTINKRE